MIILDDLKKFFGKQAWTFAKTYANKAPHEYIVRHKHTGTDAEFMSAVEYIQENGITMYYWNHPNKYIFLDGRQYWVMRDGEDDPSTIINRCNLDEYKLSITWKGAPSFKDVFEFQEYYPLKVDRERILRQMPNEQIDELIETCGTQQAKIYYASFKNNNTY